MRGQAGIAWICLRSNDVVPEGSTWIEKYAEGLAIGLITSFAAMLLLLLILLIRRRQKKKTGNIAGSERK